MSSRWRVVPVLSIFSLCCVPPILSAAPAGKHPRVIHVNAVMFKFVPRKITVKKGETVKLEITSKDVDHGFRIRSLGIDVPLEAGKTTEVQLQPSEAGTLTADCGKFCGPGHKDMKLVINVKP